MSDIKRAGLRLVCRRFAAASARQAPRPRLENASKRAAASPAGHATAARAVWNVAVAGALRGYGNPVLAASFSLATRRRYGWRVFYGVAALGIATHTAGDVIAAYGAMLFAPLSDRRYSLPLAFLIDPYFTALIVAALHAAMVFPAQRWITGAGLAALAAYLVWLGLLQRQAVAMGAEYVQRQSLHGARSEALPQPLSLLHRQT